MKTKYLVNLAGGLVFLSGLLSFWGCVESFEAEAEAQTEEFPAALVVDAQLTNVVRQHEVKLSEAGRLGFPSRPISNAIVSVTDDAETVYSFEEDEPGIYRAVTPFGASPERSYRLNIRTEGGESYVSTAVSMAGTTEIEAVHTAIGNNADNASGIIISANTTPGGGEPAYFRYTYEETFQVLAPNWRPRDLIIVSRDPLVLDFANRPEEELICYRTQTTETLFITNTNGQEGNRIVDFPVRFIDANSYITRYRYSAQVTQYEITSEAFAYFEALKNISGPKEIFSATQPGQFEGNIFSETDPEQTVLGFFELAYESSERIFFNHEDIFPGPGNTPEFYFYQCGDAEFYPKFDPQVPGSEEKLLEMLDSGNFVFLRDNGLVPPPEEGRYVLTSRECADCTVLGSSEQPDFWIE